MKIRFLETTMWPENRSRFNTKHPSAVRAKQLQYWDDEKGWLDVTTEYSYPEVSK